MAFGQQSNGSNRLAMIAGGNGGAHVPDDEEEDEGLVGVVLMTLGVFVALFVFAYLFLGPVLYSFDSDAEPTGHSNLGRMKYDFSLVFDTSLAPAAMRGAIEQKCGRHSIDADLDPRRIPVGYSLTAYSRAVERVECVLTLPKQNFCSGEGSQYAVDLIVAYDAARGAIAGLNKSVQNLDATLGGSMTLLYSTIEQDINSSTAFNRTKDGVKQKREPITSDAIIQLKKSPFPAPFDGAIAQAVGGLSEEGYIDHRQFPDYGIMMSHTISGALKPQVYSPSCG